MFVCCCFQQKTAYVMRISDWSSYVCSSDLAAGKKGIAGTRVLIVDNEPAALQSLRALLEGWGCEVDAVAGSDAAEAAMAANDASLWLFDYHLDDGDTGAALHARLARRFGARPEIGRASCRERVCQYV